MRYFICLSYNGSAFCGWQIQDNAPSVQEELQKALKTLLREDISVTGAGRTDSGVNAVNYIAHFNCQNPIQNTKNTVYKLNAILPKEIAIDYVIEVHETAHARFDATSRSYKYFIHTKKEPFNSQFSYFIPHKEIDFEKMNIAAKYFLGEQDFSSLEKVNGGNKTSICNVTEAYWEPIDDFPNLSSNKEDKNNTLDGDSIAQNDNKEYHSYVFTVTANRFLRNMVRAMVGSLLEVGYGKKEPEWILEMLKQKNRCAAGHSVPGNALFLYKIEYPYLNSNSSK